MVAAGPFDPTRGGIAWGDSPLYHDVMRTGFHNEHGSPNDVIKALAGIEGKLPIGTRFKIEQVYHATRGYEPGKPRTGSVVKTTYLELIAHGAWYDPKTGKAKPAKWRKWQDESRVRS